jgi:3-phosphoshikimate 1-carboxyvinyltransferase
MGVQVDTDAGKPPIVIRGGNPTPGTRHELPVASAQVKSCVLLAGRRVGVWVREPRQSRDHTERMLRAMGAVLHEEDGGYRLEPVDQLNPVDVLVPRDLSAAAFWLVAGCITPGSDLRLDAVGVNPTRAGVLDALLAMGAQIEVRPIDGHVEPLADLRVRHTQLKGAVIDGELALRCLDEIPVLAVAAAFAEGTTVIKDAGELRLKESDRIERMVAGLRSLGVQVEALPDGMVIEGGRPTGVGRVDAHGDHRIAMAFAVAGAAAPGGVRIDGAGSVSSSYPEFFATLAALRGLE